MIETKAPQTDAYGLILEAIDSGIYRPGARLVESELAERFGVDPTREPLPLGRTVEDTTADAILLIGDRAMNPLDEQFEAVWDLGDEWLKWTGLPFVFAMWVMKNQKSKVMEIKFGGDEGLLINLDKDLLVTEGKELIEKLLVVLQTYKSSGNFEKGFESDPSRTCSHPSPHQLGREKSP